MVEMKFFGLVFLMITFLSCADLGLSGKKDVRYPYVRVEELVNNGKFDEATEIAKKENIQPHLGIRRIEAVKFCKPILDECNGKDLNSQIAKECLYKISEHCQKKYLTSKYEDELNSLNNRLIENKDKPSFSVKGMCEDGMRWGYLRLEKTASQYDLYTDKKDFKKLHGEFLTKDKCEEARILEDSKFNTSTSCYRRYLGQVKTLPLYVAIGMKNTSKIKLYFSSEDSCKKATIDGLNQYGDYGVDFYGSIKSSAPNKFIKECEEEEVIICKRFALGELFLEEVN
jgi:hypothetical protein